MGKADRHSVVTNEQLAACLPVLPFHQQPFCFVSACCLWVLPQLSVCLST